tara:strand:+ start:202 stop:762 length:561 start_codon:yes stop_codon:yes gene_type:complete
MVLIGFPFLVKKIIQLDHKHLHILDLIKLGLFLLVSPRLRLKSGEAVAEVAEPLDGLMAEEVAEEVTLLEITMLHQVKHLRLSLDKMELKDHLQEHMVVVEELQILGVLDLVLVFLVSLLEVVQYSLVHQLLQVLSLDHLYLLAVAVAVVLLETQTPLTVEVVAVQAEQMEQLITTITMVLGVVKD